MTWLEKCQQLGKKAGMNGIHINQLWNQGSYNRNRFPGKNYVSLRKKYASLANVYNPHL